MTNFWNERYASEDYIYGTSPNIFFKKVLDNLPAGKLLIPGDGEGRNSVYAASKGWEVFAFDSSSEGRKKALHLAKLKGVSFRYDISDYESFKTEEKFDALALIFTHVSPEIRRLLHKKYLSFLKPGASVILQVFSKEQLGLPSGGPKDIGMLCSTEELKEDFKELSELNITQEFIELKEGDYHTGKAHVISLRGKK